jgi:hypothetical protein
MAVKTLERERTPGRKQPSTVAENVTQGVVVIQHGEKRFRLRRPISLKVELKEGGVWIEFPAVGILAAEKTEVAALESLAEEFAFCWEFYAQENDRNLTAGARELKESLLMLVAAVEKA